MCTAGQTGLFNLFTPRGCAAVIGQHSLGGRSIDLVDNGTLSSGLINSNASSGIAGNKKHKSAALTLHLDNTIVQGTGGLSVQFDLRQLWLLWERW